MKGEKTMDKEKKKVTYPLSFDNGIRVGRYDYFEETPNGEDQKEEVDADLFNAFESVNPTTVAEPVAFMDGTRAGRFNLAHEFSKRKEAVSQSEEEPYYKSTEQVTYGDGTHAERLNLEFSKRKEGVSQSEESPYKPSKSNESGLNTNRISNLECEVAKIKKGLQEDLEDKYERKIAYEIRKRQIDIDSASINHSNRLKYEEALYKLKIQYKTYLQTLGVTVYRDTEDSIILAVRRPDNGVIVSKQLISVKGFSSTIFVANGPENFKVLAINWENSPSGPIYFHFGGGGIDPKTFHRTLKSRGVLFLVSGRTEKKAAEALLAFALYNAEQKEILYEYGWCVTFDGKWKFAFEEEYTMKGVLTIAV